MKKINQSFLFLLIAFQLSSQSNYTDYVNPFIGTGGHGHTFPGSTVPFGMVQLSPDTRVDGSWDGCGGYHYNDSLIYGFSHTHLSGTGCSDYGDIMFVPTATVPVLNGKQYSAGYSHKNEKASAGYYAVQFNNKIKAELTTTTRVGMHKYTFPATTEAWVILDLSHRDKTLETQLKVVDKTHIEGMRRSEAWAKDQHIYFVAEFSEPFETDNDYETKEPAIMKRHAFKFASGKTLLLKVGISTVSIEGARKNLEAELKHWDFDKVKNDAQALWNKELSKIEVTGKEIKNKQIFYTALYHTMIQPNVNMDVDGMYRGMDNKVHKAEGFTYYSVFSLWDTFRAAHPLYTIIDKKRSLDFIQTFLAHYEQGGRLPVWELASNETDCMIGYHSVSVITDAYLKGIKGFDAEKALQAMKKSATWNHLGLPAYMEHGYLSMDDEHESVSKTLEYAYDDWCIAQMAKATNHTDDYNNYIQRAQYYKNIFDAGTGFMHPKKNGNWLLPFDAKEVNNNFTEANSWQYSFFVPQDVSGLIELHGGEKKFEKKLDELFSTSTKTTGREQADITGLIGQYAQGNEPSHHMAYLYNYIGKPNKTQQRIRQILNDFYKPAPDGLIGNEDCGQMSAWYVLSAMGIYQVCPGKPEFTFAAPLFNEIKINLENGKQFVIKAEKAAVKNCYITAINGQSNYVLPYSQIENGGVMNIELSAVPPVAYKNAQFPISAITEKSIVPVPVIVSAGMAFKEKMVLNIVNPFSTNKIYYTTNGDVPTTQSKLFAQAITIDTSCTIKAIAINNKGEQSFITVSKFFETPNNWKITLKSHYSKQYSAGGDEGIIDGIRGDANWRKGGWQGYQSENFEAVIDLKKIQNVSNFSVGCLQDERAWIMMPAKIEIEISVDGKTFTPAGTIVNDVSDKDENAQVKDFSLVHKKADQARYVRVKAFNYGKLPAWHQGAGGDAYIFIDEIRIR